MRSSIPHKDFSQELYHLNPKIFFRLKNFSRFTAIFAIVAGIAALYGWIFDFYFFRSIYPHFATMKVNTALCFILCGFALWGLNQKSRFILYLGQGAVLIALLISFVTLVEYASGYNLKIDQLILQQTVDGEKTLYPGRMAWITGVNFILYSSSLILFYLNPKNRVNQILVFFVFFSSLLALIGYVYGVRFLYNVGPYTGVSLNTALTFLLLTLGLLATFLRNGRMRLLIDQTSGAILLRRTLPACFVLPVIVGWIRLQGEMAGLYNASTGVALFALSNVAIFGLLTWKSALILDQIDRKRQASEEHLRLVIETAPNALMMVNHKREIILMNAQVEKIFGYHRSEIIGCSIDRLIPHRFRYNLYDEPNKSYFSPDTRPMGTGSNLTGLHKTGIEVPIEVGFNPLSIEKEVFILISVIDITERKRADETRSQLAAIVDSSEDAIIGKTLDGIIFSWNRGAEKLYGYKAEETIGKPITIIVPLAQQNEVTLLLERIKHGEHIKQYETIRIKKDQQRVYVSVTLSPIINENGEVIGGSVIARDTTEIRQLQDKLFQAEKLSAIGQLSAGIAHELNSPLQGLLGLLQVYQKRRAEQIEEFGHLSKMVGACEYMAKIVADLSAFARESKHEFEELDLKEVVISTLSFSEQLLIKRGIEIEKKFSDLLPKIKGNKNQLQQVVLNLIGNAADAMPHGGVLTIRAGTEKRKVVLEFQDTGLGITEENLKKIFDPFFTTKPYGQGVGLGLSVTFGIIKNHGGEIQVKSTPQEGTRFIIHFNDKVNFMQSASDA